MIIREMIANDIYDLAKLYKQFWNEESCAETMVKQFNKLQKDNSYLYL